MALCWDSFLPNECDLTDSSMSTSSISVVSSDLPRPGKIPAGDLMAPCEAIESRIEMRLLRDTRSVLEYL